MSEDACTGCGCNKTNAYCKSTCVKRCVVKDDSNLDDTHIYDPSPPPNLYLPQSTWTCGETPRGVGMATVRRFFRGGPSPQKSLSRLSNVCQKIQLHRHIQQDAWKMFAAISRRMPQKVAGHTRTAALHICGGDVMPVPGSGIVEITRTSFGRKNPSTMARMTCQHMPEYGGSRKNEDRYYFNAVLMERIVGGNAMDSGFARCEWAARLLLTWICCGMIAGLEATKWQRNGI